MRFESFTIWGQIGFLFYEMSFHVFCLLFFGIVAFLYWFLNFLCGLNNSVCTCAHSVMSDSATPWIIVHLAPMSMEYSRQEYWSGLPFPAPGDLPQPGIEPHLLHLLHWQANSLPLQKPIIVLLVTCCEHVLTVYDFSLFSKHLFIFFVVVV